MPIWRRLLEQVVRRADERMRETLPITRAARTPTMAMTCEQLDQGEGMA